MIKYQITLVDCLPRGTHRRSTNNWNRYLTIEFQQILDKYQSLIFILIGYNLFLYPTSNNYKEKLRFICMQDTFARATHSA